MLVDDATRAMTQRAEESLRAPPTRCIITKPMPDELYQAQLAEYYLISQALVAQEEALEKLKAERSTLVKKILDEHGKGPHTIRGKELYIYSRGFLWFFSALRGKKTV